MTSDDLVTNIDISFEFEEKHWALRLAKKLNLDVADVPADKNQSLWRFQEDEFTHKENLETSNLTYLAQLTPADYYQQLPIIRELFKKQTLQSLNEFIIDLKPEEIIEAIKEAPVITKNKWIEFEQQKNQSELHQKLSDRKQLELTLEQQFRFQMNLNPLKTSLGILKQKLALLASKLELLKK